MPENELENKKPLYIQIFEILRDRIISGQYPIDSKIPSVTMISGEMSVAHLTAFKAIRKLAEEGYVFSSVGKNKRKGTFVISKEPSKRASGKKVIATVFASVDEKRGTQGLLYNLLCLIQAEIAKNKKLATHNFSFIEESSVNHLEEEINKEEIDGIIICAYTPQKIIDAALAKKIPVIMVNAAVDQLTEGIHYVFPDFEYIGSESVRIIAESGKFKEVKFHRLPPEGKEDRLWKNPMYFAHRKILTGIENVIKKHKLQLNTFNDLPLEYYEKFVNSYYEREDSALISVSGNLCNSIYDNFKKADNLRLKENGLISIKELLAPKSTLPGWSIKPEKLAVTAVTLISMYLEDNDLEVSGRTVVPPVWVD
ncbi:MAG: GntR family transcriptional regulator [Planctomycetota bacterium]